MSAIPVSGANGPSSGSSFFLFRWLSFGRSTRAKVQETPTNTVVLPEENIDTLLIKANQSKAPHDIEAFLNRASKDQRRIVLELQIPSVGTVSVIGGFIEKTSWLNEKLVLLFRELQSDDLDVARRHMKLVTNNDPRHHDPPYFVFIGGRQILVSFKNPDYYHIRNIALA